MKKVIYYCLFLVTISSFSQEKDYFIAGNDTVYVTEVGYSLTSQHDLSTISYYNEIMVLQEIKDKKYLATITSLSRKGVITDRIPQKADKPDGHVKWAERVVDGKLKVNFYQSVLTSYNNRTPGLGSTVSSSITKFFIKMPDGTYYDIRKNSDLKKKIIPYLKECAAFNNAYSGEITEDYESFIKVVKIYNSVCN